jgi:hypothetical protein
MPPLTAADIAILEREFGAGFRQVAYELSRLMQAFGRKDEPDERKRQRQQASLGVADRCYQGSDI